jgi:hypothetical protein
MEVTGSQGSRRQQLLDFLEKKEELKGDSLDGSVWRNHCGRDYGPVMRWTTE